MLSDWLRHRLHQTPVSRALRSVPGVRAAAQYWWLRSQGASLRSSLESVSPPIYADSATDVVLDLPTVEQLAVRESSRVKSGDAFALEMRRWCETSKFQSLGYQDVYAPILSHLRSRSPRVLEVGIGINDPNSPSGMERTHLPGASLTGWANYFPGAEVHGADIDRRVLVDTELYTTHWVDQRDAQSLMALGEELGVPLDLVVDDGLHTPEANGLTVMALLPYLSIDGVFVVEDILSAYDEMWAQAERWIPSHYGLAFFPGGVLRGSRNEGLAVLWREQ